MVDQQGQRYCDEAGAYMEIGQRMYQRHAQTGKAVPSWVIMDSRQRNITRGVPRRRDKCRRSGLRAAISSGRIIWPRSRPLRHRCRGACRHRRALQWFLPRPAKDRGLRSRRPRLRSRARRSDRQAQPELGPHRAGRRFTRSPCIRAMWARRAAWSLTNSRGCCAATARSSTGCMRRAIPRRRSWDAVIPEPARASRASFVFGYIAAQHAARRRAQSTAGGECGMSQEHTPIARHR